MKRKKYVLAGLFLLVLLWAGTIQADASEEHDVIKVGYPIQEGLTGKDEEGEYIGYTYEYLMTISQYTGYRYEFVEVPGDEDTQLETLLMMLENGDIDLLGAMGYSDSLTDKYDYVMNHYGNYEKGLYVLDENVALNSTSIYSMGKIRVAVFGSKESSSFRTLERYVAGIGLELEAIMADSLEEQVKALESGAADALLANNLGIPEGIELRCVCHFDAQPFYFAVTKGNAELLNEINEAIAAINTANPYYMTTLMQKYFYNTSQKTVLTEEEKSYLEDLDTLDVLILGCEAPIVYTDLDNQPSGIAVSILQYMTSQVGIKLNITSADDFDEYQKELEKGSPDLIICNTEEDWVTETGYYLISMPYLTVPVSLVIHAQTDPSELKDAQRAEAYDLYTKDAEFYGTVEDCLKAIEKGEADYTYVNSYSVEYYMNRLTFENIYSFQQDVQNTQSYSVGIQSDLGKTMLSIINKCIHNVPQEELFRTYLYENNLKSTEITWKEFVSHNKEMVILIVVITVAVVLLTGILWKYSIEKKNKEQILEQSKRDGLTGVYTGAAFRKAVDEKIKNESGRVKNLFIMVDIDKFKDVNDSYGHYFGDQVLRGFAKASQEVFCDGEILGRVGGDEFVIFSNLQEPMKKLDEKCKLLKEKLRKLPATEGKMIITVSMGGVISDQCDDYERLFRKADEVMYQVKHRGRDGVEIRDESGD